MCGIVGAAARRDVVGTLIAGLKSLEYRGYDSAGIALLTDAGLERVRTKGKVRELEELHASQPITGLTGIAHTRWATHGAPNTTNAHPIASRDQTAVVHNGIIENHEELRAELKALGYAFATETDTEVIAHLVEHEQSQGATLLQSRAARDPAPARRVRDRGDFQARTRTRDRRAARQSDGRRVWPTANSSSPPTSMRCCR